MLNQSHFIKRNNVNKITIIRYIERFGTEAILKKLKVSSMYNVFGEQARISSNTKSNYEDIRIKILVGSGEIKPTRSHPNSRLAIYYIEDIITTLDKIILNDNEFGIMNIEEYFGNFKAELEI